MKKTVGITLIIALILSCKNAGETAFQQLNKEACELYKPTKKAKAVLILFGGYPEKIEDVKREFSILELAKDNEIAVLFMNFNQRLWLGQNEKQHLTDELEDVFKHNNLPKNNMYVGGFSSGGNVALLIGDYLTK